MLSEIAQTVFGPGVMGNILYFFGASVDCGHSFTCCNTCFKGFLELASFVAEKRFSSAPGL